MRKKELIRKTEGGKETSQLLQSQCTPPSLPSLKFNLKTG